MTRPALFAAAAVLAAFFMQVAQAQVMPVVCQPHHKVKKELLEKYGEVLVAHGLAGSSTLFELYVGQSGSFTVVLMRASAGGLACIQGAGSDFSWTGNEPPPIKKKDSPA